MKSHGIVFQGRKINGALTVNFSLANIKVQFSRTLCNLAGGKGNGFMCTGVQGGRPLLCLNVKY